VAANDPDRRDGSGPLRAVPALARLAASAWWHAAERSVGMSLDIGSRLVRTALGDRVSPPRPSTGESAAAPAASDSRRAALRERGAELLAQSADVSHAEDLHPAYARILDNLSPDEARILRLFTTRGPQPAIDVRHGLPLVSELVAPGLNMIGAEAGCRYPDRVPAYLDNLNRLGLIWFSRETLPDINPYQVLEAQPDAVEAMRRAGRTSRTVRRSIHLTPFGTDLCAVCLPLETPDEQAGREDEPERDGGSGGA
jgi:abortive infection alpha-like protein